MKFRLLGALELGPAIPLGGPRQRAVLAALLFRANDTASIEYLTRAAWDEPPVAPESNLRTYVAGLRKALRQAGADADRLATRSGGYSLAVRAGELDLSRFEKLAHRGSLALRNSEFAAAAEFFRGALGLWRGQPMEGQAVGPALQVEIARLQEHRFAVVSQYSRACLELGQYAGLVDELQQLVHEHPLREELSAQLMLALYRSGRQAEALDVFRLTRERLVGELGIEPGLVLRRAQSEILAGEAPRSVGRAQPSGSSGCRQLPMDVEDFTGRHGELGRLRQLAAATPDEHTLVCAIEGMAGVGKTTLANHAAHLLAQEGCFDEVQLWADLRGFTAEQAPADPGVVLRTFLQSLGVPGEQIPPSLEERATLYRGIVSGKRTLVVLDNAAGEDQVRPLIPGGPNCLVLVTSRRSIGGLDGARQLVLDVFSPDEAIGLLARVAGADRVAAEPDAAASIVRLCGYLPLAVVLGARRLRSRPSWKLTDLVDRLASGDRRLDQLKAGTRGVRAAFDVSCASLPRDEARLFRLLGVHPGVEFTAQAAAALASVSPVEAELMLDCLLDAYLIEQVSSGRYRMHDLLRDYAHEHADHSETLEALGRLLAWYLYTADAADRKLQPDRRRLPLDPGTAPRDRLKFATRQEAMAWLEAERANLVEAVQIAGESGLYRVAWQLPSAVLGWFYLRKHWDDWIRTYHIALFSARRLNDLAGQAVALNGLGVAYTDLKQYADSIDCYQQALAIEQRIGSKAGQAWCHNNLGVAFSDLRRFSDAADAFRQALVLHQESDSAYGEGIALSNLGDTYRELDDLATAETFLQQAIRLQRSHGDEAGQRYTLACIGDLYYATQHHDRAIHYYQRSLTASRHVGDRWKSACVLTRMAQPLRATGNAEAAHRCAHEANTILDQLGPGAKADELRAQIGHLLTPASLSRIKSAEGERA